MGEGKEKEIAIQARIENMLRSKGWFVLRTHGNLYQMGFPDIYATHSKFKARWIEVKQPNMQGSRFTNAQREVFPKLIAHGAGVWILTASTEEEYDKLFRPCNYHAYAFTWLKTKG